MARSNDLDNLRRSIAMLSPKAMALSREDALALLDELANVAPSTAVMAPLKLTSPGAKDGPGDEAAGWRAFRMGLICRLACLSPRWAESEIRMEPFTAQTEVLR